MKHVLDRLVDHGLVDRLEAGSTLLYSLNRDHLLAPAVEQMASARAEMIRRLREEIGGWELPAVHASLFGSAARGQGDVFFRQERVGQGGKRFRLVKLRTMVR